MSRFPMFPLSPLRAAAVLAMWMVATWAHATPAEDAERARLSQERASIDATYSSRLAQCQTRFVVTSCVDDAKRDRRHGLDALRARQIVVDEARRKERSATRSSELAAHAAEEARRDSERAKRPAPAASEPAVVRDAPSRALEPRRPVTEHAASSKRRAVHAEEPASGAKGVVAADRVGKEARSRATFEAKQQQAAEHRQEVEDKAIKRAKQHPSAAPLPIPKDIQTAP